MEYEIVSRDRWGSTSKWRWGDMQLPAAGVYLHHSVTAVTGFPYKDTKQIELEGIARFGQMSYSYLVHPSAVILEGAGTKIGAHTLGRNTTSFGICLIGDYDDGPGADPWIVPNRAQIDAVRWLLYYLKVEKNWLVDGAILQPHQAVVATACPGNKTMPLFEQFRVPWVPPVPTPPPAPALPEIVVGVTQEIDMRVTNVALNIRIDNNGRGWVKVPYRFDRILSIIPHSGTRPGVDGHYDGTPDNVAATPDGDGTIIVIQGGNSGATSPVWLRVIEA